MRELRYIVDQRMKSAMVALQARPTDISGLDRTLAMARTAHELPFELNLWQAQNIWHQILTSSPALLPEMGSGAGKRWQDRFTELGRQLGIAVEQLVVEDEPAGEVPA